MDQNKINQFTQKAKAAGYSDAEIAAEIERKRKELSVPQPTTRAVTPPPPKVEPVATPSATMDISQPEFTPPAPQPPKTEEKKGFLQGGIFSKIMDVLSIPSYAIGGATKASRESAAGTYQAPKTGLAFNMPTKGGEKRKVDVGELMFPTLVGAYRGVKNRQAVMEEAPKLLGLDPESAAGMAVGFGAELLTPDTSDVLGAGKLLKKGIGKISNKAEDIIEAGARSLGLKSVKPSPSQMRVFKEATKKDIGTFILDKKLFGRGTEAVDEVIAPLQDSFDSIVANSGKKVSAQELAQIFTKRSEELLSEAAPELKSKGEALQTYANNLLEKLQKAGMSEIDVADLTKERRTIDDLVKKFKMDDAVKSNNQEIRDILQGTVRDKVKDIKVGGKNLQDIGVELSELYKFRDIAKAQEGIMQSRIPVGLREIMGGAALGTFSGETWQDKAKNFLIGAGMVKLADNPKVIAKAAEFLQKFAKVASGGTAQKVVKGAVDTAKKGLIVGGRAVDSEVVPESPVAPAGAPTTPPATTTTQGMDISEAEFAPVKKEVMPETQTGYTIEQHLEALSQATAAGDKAAVKQIKDQLAIEEKYQALKAEKEKSMGEKEKLTKEQGMMKNAEINLKKMKDTYGVGTKKSLSAGKYTVGIPGLIAKGSVAAKKQTNQDYVDRLTEYQNMRSFASGLLNQVRGAGVLNKDEYETMVQNMPSENSSEKAASAWFANMEDLLKKMKAEGVGGLQFSGGQQVEI